MKLILTKEWCLRTASLEPDDPCEAGPALVEPKLPFNETSDLMDLMKSVMERTRKARSYLARDDG